MTKNLKKKTKKEIIDQGMAWVAARNPHEPEFHQAVKEVAISILPFLLENPQYTDAKIFRRLTEPDRIVSFRVAWRNDQGGIEINRGYRVQHNNAIGPYKGGIRFHPSVNQSILKFLAFEQTFKNSLTGLPMGGGKGGADFDPKGKSDAEVEGFCQAFMTELYRHIGPNTDVPAGDIGVGAREVSYLFGQYKRIQNEFTGVLTGKGLAFGGSEIRVEATGYGCVYFMAEMLKHQEEALEGKTCLISGAGNVAQYTVEKLIQMGAKPLTLSDSSGYVYDPDGIDSEKLEWVKALKNVRRGRIEAYAEKFGTTFHAGKRPWEVPAQLAFPCATQNELLLEDAKLLLKNGCIGVAEGANMPSDQAAIDAFLDAKILFAPSKAANAGGVAVSGLEMTQNSMRLSWSRDELEQNLKKIMKDIHKRCAQFGAEENNYVNYLKGANIAGFIKVADAMLAYGLM
jgi:glutamate dehydrogenase/leucine dehydrogenase